MWKLLAVLALSLFAPAAMGAIVTWKVSGTVTLIDDDTGLIPIPVSLGDAFEVVYTFDDSVASQGGLGPGRAIYRDALTDDIFLPSTTHSWELHGASHTDHL